MIPPPDSQIMQSLSAMFTKGDYAACLKASESRIGESLFWLDLSRLSAQSLDSMGTEYKEAGDTVRNVTAAYVERLPQITTLSFADGTPFADASTKEWLAGLRKSSDTATSNGEEVSIESRFTKALSQGADLIRDNKRNEAITQLKDTLNGAVTPQEQYLFSAAMARLLTGMGRSDLAQANVDAIISTIDNFTLERWDPNLALIGLEAAYMALAAYQEGDTLSTESKRTDIIMRMTRLDPSRTLEVVGG
jgi:type VI secretion system protein VasJ